MYAGLSRKPILFLILYPSLCKRDSWNCIHGTMTVFIKTFCQDARKYVKKGFSSFFAKIKVSLCWNLAKRKNLSEITCESTNANSYSDRHEISSGSILKAY